MNDVYNYKINPHIMPTSNEFLKSLDDCGKVTALIFEIKGLNHINIRLGFNFTNQMLDFFIIKLNELVYDYGQIYRTDRNVFVIKFIKNKSVECIKEVHKILSEFFKQVFIEEYSLSFEIASGAIVDFEYNKEDKYKIISTLALALGKSNADTLYPLVFLNEDSFDNNLKNLKILEEIKNCIVHDCKGFYLEYQPFVSGINSKIIGAEALVRWHSDEVGVLSPGIFIPYVENFSCSYDLGMWIIKKALEDAKVIIEEKSDFFININLSYSQLENPNFKFEVIKLLDELKFPHKNLQFELTERCKKLDIEYLKEQISFFRENGIRMALDDFGTGTSTLRLIADLPIDCVKIDKSFILNIINNPSNAVIVETVLDCAKRLGISVCLEGIENIEIKNFVAKYYANYHQGYYYSKPLKFNEFKQIIDKTWKSEGISLIKSNNKSSFDVNNIISMMPGGFFIYVNDESEKIILANEALLDIFECDTMEEFMHLTGNSFKGMVHKDDYERVDKEIKEQITSSSKCYDQVKYKITTKNGKIKNILDYGHLVQKEYNDDVFYVFIVEEM